MFKAILESAILSIVQGWMTTTRSPKNSEAQSPIHINERELKAFLIRIGSLATLCLLNFMLFVGSLIVTAVAVARNIEVFGRFVATPVFWSGVIMLGTALVIEILAAWALLSTKVSVSTFIVAEPSIEPTSVKDRLFMPFLEGLAAGLLRARRFEERDGSHAA